MNSRYNTSYRILASTTTVLLALVATSLQRISVVSAIEPEPRIVGGNDADFMEYPYFTSWGRSCGATLIHEDILLTAAHVSHDEQSENLHRKFPSEYGNGPKYTSCYRLAQTQHFSIIFLLFDYSAIQ